MSQACRRLGAAPVAVGVIKLVVVGSITGMLFVSSVLLLSQKLRQGDASAVCASRLVAFGRASGVYEDKFGCFAPCDPHRMMYRRIRGVERPRLDNSAEKMDPAHGWLARYAAGVIPQIADPADKPWEAVPFGFNRQSKHNPYPQIYHYPLTHRHPQTPLSQLTHRLHQLQPPNQLFSVEQGI